MSVRRGYMRQDGTPLVKATASVYLTEEELATVDRLRKRVGWTRDEYLSYALKQGMDVAAEGLWEPEE